MITERKKQVLDFFSEGRKQYKLMEFENALQLFQKALDADPEDGPSKVYAERCRLLSQNPPPEDWDGVFVMKTK